MRKSTVFACFVCITALMLCGCEIRLKVESEPADQISEARDTMQEILEAPAPQPVPDERFTPDPPARDPEPLEPIAVGPPGWPDGLKLQKWTGPHCAPCAKWDSEERWMLPDVMLPDLQAFDAQGLPTPEARANGVDVVPYFQLKRGNEIVWQGRGYFTGAMLITRAQQHGKR